MNKTDYRFFLKIYNIFFFLMGIITLPFWLLSTLLVEKRRRTFFHRLGIMPLPDTVAQKTGKPKPIWMHALSVGEIFSSLELVKGLKKRYPRRPFFFSVSTATGREEAEALLKDEVDAIFFFPYDFIVSVKRIVDRVAPEFLILVESDIWPCILHRMHRQMIPVILVNGRVSKTSLKGYLRIPGLDRQLFGTFALVCAQSAEDALRFRQLGVESNRMVITGNLKFDQKKDSLSEEDIAQLKASLRIDDKSPVFVAGSTHSGEEKIMFRAYRNLRYRVPELKLIIVPRHPGRGQEVYRMCEGSGWIVEKMSRPLERQWDVLIVDVMGLLGKLYSLGNVTFVGGSLVPEGGHNPLEPAAFAKPILFGPDMSDFRDICQMLLSSGGAFQVKNHQELTDIALTLLTEPHRAKNDGKNAFRVFNDNHGATLATIDAIGGAFGNGLN